MALTRPKRGLLVLGHKPTLRSDPVWGSFLDFVQAQGLEGTLAGGVILDERGELQGSLPELGAESSAVAETIQA